MSCLKMFVTYYCLFQILSGTQPDSPFALMPVSQPKSDLLLFKYVLFI